MSAGVEDRHPVGDAVSALFHLVEAAAAARYVEGDHASVIRVELGNPGEFEEWAAIGVGLGTAPIEPVDERPVTRTLGYDLHDFDIVCVALAWSGDDEAREPLMFRAFELVDVVREVLRVNPRLGLESRAVQSAWVDRSGLGWEDVGRGVQALVEFTVRVSASRRRR